MDKSDYYGGESSSLNLIQVGVTTHQIIINFSHFI